MRYQDLNAINNKVSKRRRRDKDHLEIRSESSVITRTYGFSNIVYGGSIINHKIIDHLPLTKTHLSGNLVIDNLCRHISWQGSIKAYSERSEDAKQCTPRGAGRLPEVRKIIDSRQFAWNFFLQSEKEYFPDY